MRSKTLHRLAIFAGVLLWLAPISGMAVCQQVQSGTQPNKQTSPSATDDTDPISGEWNITFHNRERETHATFTFILDEGKVTGTAYSDATGAGSIRDGKWSDGKLSFTLGFKKYEPVLVTGTFKDGILVGEFITDGFSVKWEGTKSSSEQ